MTQKKLPPQSSTLFDLKDSVLAPQPNSISPGSIAALKGLLGLGTDKEFVALLLELAEFRLPHVRYLAGPIVVSGGGWQDTIPSWLLEAIPVARFEAIAAEAEAGEVGELATAEEMLACLYPATMIAPMSHRWYQVYMYVGNEVLTKHKKLPPEQSFWELMNIAHPITYEQVKYDYNELALDIRKRVIKQAAARGVGKRPRSQQSQADSTEAPQAAKSTQPLKHQLSLFELEG
ncbi:hypothetical protein [Allocoleopsis franciscana]|uniref:Uncharacterized protein n=1 Tax=Allocoleopsis franciscana PCC 7113 TaxID=1173027 RepID=K9WR50_9CYAN|nr:hypothetical protein [Allocoleopsis franciscana]AFZ22032.1 hypothetical protein Mic7113_6452 [Allocoleopsis franciscana PCC 7113]